MSKRKRAFKTAPVALALVILTALTSCSFMGDNSGNGDGNTVPGASGPAATLIIEEKVSDAKPVYRFVFEYYGDSEMDFNPAPCRLTIYDKTSGAIVQAFEFEGVCFDGEIQARLADLNFDGYLDLIAEVGHGARANSGQFSVYCWQENGTTEFEGFVSQPSLEYSDESQIEIFPDTHQLIAHGDGMTCMYQVERCDNYSMPEIRLLRYYVYDWMTDEAVRFYERTDMGNKLIYECPFSHDKNAVWQNVLRFGTQTPISTQKALQIASEQYPDAGLALKQMLTFNGESYFHIQWSRDNETGDCGVSVDSGKTVDCAPYLNELNARAVPSFNGKGDIV